MAKLVSKVYGDALFEEAMEKDVLSQWYEEICALRTVFLDNPDLAQFLNHPQIIKEEKKKVVETIFFGKLSEGLLGFLVTIIEKGRQNDMIPICDYFTDRVKAYKKIGVVKVTSALPLSEDQKKRVENRLLETTGFVSLETEYAVDESLLGGLVIRIGDRVVDSSIKTRLEEIRRDLMKLHRA